MGVIWGGDRPIAYHARPRRLLPVPGGLVAFLHSIFSYWRRGF